jgi:hypothetical protein
MSERYCRCGGTGWLCAGTDKPADFEHGTCCNPSECEEFTLGPGCPSADGCPDCRGGLRRVILKRAEMGRTGPVAFRRAVDAI